MSTTPEVRSEETEMISLGSHKTVPYEKLAVKNISDMQLPVITDPIDPTRVSKVPTNRLTMKSAVKAGLIFLGTVGAYYLAKTTKVLSYFKWGVKTKNSKDMSSNEIMEVKNEANTLTVRKNLETKRKAKNPFVNQFVQAYKDKGSAVKFEEIKVQEFKNLLNVEKEGNVKTRKSVSRRSINVQNPIPDQNAIVGNLFDLTISGANVFNSDSSLSFFDIPNIPNWLTSYSYYNPKIKSSCETPDRAYRVSLSDNYAYVANDESGLQVIDISNPENPTLKGSYDTPDEAWDIAVSGNYAYVTDSESGLQIIDIGDSENPTFKGSYDTPDEASGIALSGNYAYVANGWSGLQIIDISNPENPTFKGSYRTPDYAYGVTLASNYAYVADGRSGLQIIDISDPENPTFKGSYAAREYVYGVAVSGNYAYVADESRLLIIDVSDPSNPTFKASYGSGRDEIYPLGVVVSGNCAYVADEWLGLQIIDISNPKNPTFKGSCDTFEAFGVALFGNYVYLVNAFGLLIIEPNLDKLILSGTPSAVGTYTVNITACNEIMECATNSFDIIVKDTDDAVQIPLKILHILRTSLKTLFMLSLAILFSILAYCEHKMNPVFTLIISLITIIVCMACITLEIVNCGTTVLRRYHKILRNKNDADVKKLKKEKEL